MTAAPHHDAPAPMFPGQAAAPAGPCDLTGMYLVHHALRRDLARFADATAATPVEETDTWVALRRWSSGFRSSLTYLLCSLAPGRRKAARTD